MATKEEVSVTAGDEDCEDREDTEEEAPEGYIDQNVVEGLPQLFVNQGGHQHCGIEWSPYKEDKSHEGCLEVEGPCGSNVVLRAIPGPHRGDILKQVKLVLSRHLALGMPSPPPPAPLMDCSAVAPPHSALL